MPCRCSCRSSRDHLRRNRVESTVTHFFPVGLISSPRYLFLGGLCAAVLLVLRCFVIAMLLHFAPAVEVTDETIQQMVSAGMWKLPKHDIQAVLERQPQLDMIVDYIQKVQKGEKAGQGAFPLLGTAGMTGIGKTFSPSTGRAISKSSSSKAWELKDSTAMLSVKHSFVPAKFRVM